MKVKLLNENAKLPTSAETDAGHDLYASEDVFIPVGDTRIVKTGISLELESLPRENGEIPYFKIEDRSSMAAKGLRTGAGVVDAGYRGEIMIVLHNLSNKSDQDPVLFSRGYQIRKGDKIAQGVIEYAVKEPITLVDNLTQTERGAGGFGSTGR